MEHVHRAAAGEPRSDPRHPDDDAGTHSALPPPLGDARDRVVAQDVVAEEGQVPEQMRVIDILSHELRSPITTIHLGTKVLREGGRHISRPVRVEVVEAVDEEAQRLYRLVEDLLAVARHDRGAAPLPVAPLALQHWLPNVVAAEVDANPMLAVRASIPPGLPPVLADDGALGHVVRNLLANAVRFAPDGMPVEVVVTDEVSHIRIEVLDRGPGIDVADAENVFEPFYRPLAAMALGSGAGLGLAAARRLMRAMAGDIVALPRAGGGARLSLTLPVAAPDDVDDGPAVTR